MNFESLKKLSSEWQLWALHADKNEDGWQSDFPQWLELMNAAYEVIRLSDTSSQVLQVLELCWAISEEGEELLEFTIGHIDECWPTVQALAKSDLPVCRWQVYDAASAAGKKAELLLLKGLKDDDAYARRRAVLALARIKPDNARKLTEDIVKDSDPYVRQVSLEMAAVANDPEFITKISEILLADDIEHVRKAVLNFQDKA
jgi:HEAT repeat protein